MKLSRRQAFGIAAVIALIVAVLLFVVLNKRVNPPKPVEAQTASAVVAKTHIPAYTELTAGMVEVKELPKSQVPSGALSDPVEAVGQLAQFELQAGQTLTRRDVMPAGARQGLTFVIGDGMRAVTVALDPISGVGGFAQPTDRVDVVATFDYGETTISKTILQDIEVLAVNEQTIRPPVQTSETTDKTAETKKEEAPSTEKVKSATLAVTPREAQILIKPTKTTEEGGAAAAAEEAPTKETPEKEKAAKEEEEEAKPEGPPPPTVTVIRGNQREVVTMQ